MNKILTFIRIFLRDRVSLMLGIGSLTIGISISLMIGLWYINEVSYDNFHADSDNIYRICRDVFINNENKIIGSEFNPLGKNVKKEFPEVIDAVRMYPLVDTEDRGIMVEYANKKHFVNNVNFVDTTFFNFFNYKLKQGNIQEFINKPNSIILDEQTAKEMFPDENPLGKIISLRGEREVVAVMKNLPTNTHITCHALIPIQSVPRINNKGWGNTDFFITYIKLAKNTDKTELCKKMEEYSKSSFKMYEDFKVKYFLQPIKDIHLAKGFMFDEQFGFRKGNLSLINTFLIVGIVLLMIACVNFINLFISSAFLRAKAIGLKKVNGASRLHIIMEFMSETFLYTFVAGVLAVLFSYYLLPYFSQFIGYELKLDFTSNQFWLMMLSLVLFISIFAGIIPGLYMSGFHVLQILKGRFRAKRIINLQKGLVITQFTASIALLIGVFFINKQISFMNNVDLGFDKEQLVYISIPDSYVKKIKSIQAELEKSPYIKGTCLSRGTSLKWVEGSTINKPESPDEQILVEMMQVQHSYFDVYGMKIISGKNTLQDVLNEGSGQECLINEKAGELLNLEKPYVGKSINLVSRGVKTITGVVKDSYTKSLTQKIDPQVYIRLSQVWAGMTLMVKASGKDMKPVVELLRKQWQANETKYDFEYHFLDKKYESLYKTEEKAGILALWIMGIALFLTIAGLWGMARYSSDRRTKEIGIRKINGATIFEVITMLNKEFLYWVIISFVIAVPLAWYGVRIWLNNFVLRTELSWWIFVLSGLIAILVSLLTVTWQSWKAASGNPVEALRSE